MYKFIFSPLTKKAIIFRNPFGRFDSFSNFEYYPIRMQNKRLCAGCCCLCLCYIYMYVCIWKDKTLLARFHYSIWFSSLSVANLIYFYALISYFRYCLCSILLFFFFFFFWQEILTNVSVKVYFVVNQTKTSAWSLLVPSLLFFFLFLILFYVCDLLLYMLLPTCLDPCVFSIFVVTRNALILIILGKFKTVISGRGPGSATMCGILHELYDEVRFFTVESHLEGLYL